MTGAKVVPVQLLARNGPSHLRRLDARPAPRPAGIINSTKQARSMAGCHLPHPANGCQDASVLVYFLQLARRCFERRYRMSRNKETPLRIALAEDDSTFRQMLILLLE